MIEDAAESPRGRYILVRDPWMGKQDTEAIRRSGVRRAVLNGFGGAALPELDLAQVDAVAVASLNMRSDGAVQHLFGLRELTLDTYCRDRIDFRVFKRLDRLGFNWRPGGETAIGHPTVRHLSIHGYPYPDLGPLASMPQLEGLELRSRRLASLDGVESLPNLRKLSIVMATSLFSIDALGAGRTPLTDLSIYSTKRIPSLDALAGVPTLEFLSLENCGTLPSLRPLAGHPSLLVLWMAGTEIADGDMSQLLAMPKLEGTSFRNRRHYSHTREEIQARIVERTGHELNRGLFRGDDW